MTKYLSTMGAVTTDLWVEAGVADLRISTIAELLPTWVNTNLLQNDADDSLEDSAVVVGAATLLASDIDERPPHASVASGARLQVDVDDSDAEDAGVATPVNKLPKMIEWAMDSKRAMLPQS